RLRLESDGAPRSYLGFWQVVCQLQGGCKMVVLFASFGQEGDTLPKQAYRLLRLIKSHHAGQIVFPCGVAWFNLQCVPVLNRRCLVSRSLFIGRTQVIVANRIVWILGQVSLDMDN